MSALATTRDEAGDSTLVTPGPPRRPIDRDLVDRFERLIWSVARRSGLSQEDAEDAVQQTWLRLLEKEASVRDPACLPGWLVTTAGRECRAVWRRQMREVVTDVLPESGSGERGPIDALLRQEQSCALRRAVSGLPTRERALVVCLFRDKPMTYDEVSNRLGMPRGSIGPIRARALRRLSAALQASEEVQHVGAA